MRTSGRLWIVLLVGLLAVPSLAGESTDFSRHIVWSSEDPARVEFVPAGLLGEEERFDLGLHPKDLDQLDLSMTRKRSGIEKRGEVTCGDDVERGLSARPFGDKSLVELLSTDLTVLGTVVDIVPGLGFEGWALPASTLVYIRIDSILSCRPHSGFRPVAVESVVAVRLLRGDFEIDDMRFCNRTEIGLHMPSIGDSVIATGDPQQGDAYYMGRGLLFPIEDGMVQPQMYPTLGEREPIALTSILGALNDAQPVCRGRG